VAKILKRRHAFYLVKAKVLRKKVRGNWAKAEWGRYATKHRSYSGGKKRNTKKGVATYRMHSPILTEGLKGAMHRSSQGLKISSGKVQRAQREEKKKKKRSTFRSKGDKLLNRDKVKEF